MPKSEGNLMADDLQALKAKLKMARKSLKQEQSEKHRFYCALQDANELIKKIMDFVTPRCKNLTYILNLICRLHTTEKMKSAQSLGNKHELKLREQRTLYKKLIRDTYNLHAHADKIMNENHRSSSRGVAAENIALRSKIALLEHQLLKKKNKI
jgi:hypothetical protein